MYLIRCLVFTSLFLISTSDHKVQVKGCFVGSVLPRSFRLASSVTNARCFPSSVKSRSLCVLLLLCGDISLNPGPIVMGVANCRSVRNKAPMISDVVFNHSTYYHWSKLIFARLIPIVCFNPSHHHLINCVKDLVHMARVSELAFS